MIKKYLKIAIVLLVMVGCEVKPVEINYGSDACHFCKMTIVDQQHASQIVTVKRKAFKYDAIECMMNDLAEWEEAEPKLFLVSDYQTPKQLIDATNAGYLFSANIPSPMGAYLSAFDSEDYRQETVKESGGDTLSWNELKVKFKVD